MGSKIARAKGKRSSSLRPQQNQEDQTNTLNNTHAESSVSDNLSGQQIENSPMVTQAPATSVLQHVQQTRQLWAKVAVGVPTNASLPANLAFQQALVSYENSNFDQVSASSIHFEPLEHTAHSTPVTDFGRRERTPGNISVGTIETTAAIDSHKSSDNAVSSDATVHTPLILSSPSTCEEPRYYTLVDDEENLHEFLSVIDQAEDGTVDIFADTEGENGLGKDFKLNGIAIKMVSKDRRFLLDPQALGSKLFDTPAKTGKKRTLRQIFEDEKIPIVFFDVRADSNAIHGHYKLRMEGVIDLQVMEMATRGCCPWRRTGLDRCMQNFFFDKDDLPAGVKEAWIKRKNAGKEVCSGPDEYGVFNQRPLPRVLEEYAINDVELMPELFTYFSVERGICEDEEKMRLIMEVSKAMVDLSVSPEYDTQDPDNRYGPKQLTDLWPYDPYEDNDYY